MKKKKYIKKKNKICTIRRSRKSGNLSAWKPSKGREFSCFVRKPFVQGINNNSTCED
jgi:hypothetical protein